MEAALGKDLKTWLERATEAATSILHEHPELRTEAVIIQMMVEAYLRGAQHQWMEFQKNRLQPEPHG